MVKLAPGKTMQDFHVWKRDPEALLLEVQAWTRDPHGPPPMSSVGGVASLAPNRDAYFEVDLTPGDYVLLCFVTAPDGRPHTEHGMIQHIRIG